MPRKSLEDVMDLDETLSEIAGQGKKSATVVEEPVVLKQVKATKSDKSKADKKKPDLAEIKKVNITGYYDPEVKSSLRMVQAKTGKNIQSLLAEALNDLFAKHKVPETAPKI